jgi:hypothetical protein
MAVIWYWLISQLNDLLDVWLYNIITVPIEYKSKYYLNKDLHYHVFVFSSWPQNKQFISRPVKV